MRKCSKLHVLFFFYYNIIIIITIVNINVKQVNNWFVLLGRQPGT